MISKFADNVKIGGVQITKNVVTDIVGRGLTGKLGRAVTEFNPDQCKNAL